MTRDKTQWVRVTRSRLCPICEGQGWCRVSADGSAVQCMRIESDHPWPGSAGGGWIHRLGSDALAPLPPPKRAPPKAIPPIDWGAAAMDCFSAAKAAEVRKRLADLLWCSVASLEALGVSASYDDYRNLPYSTWPCRSDTGAVVGISRRYEDGTKRYVRGSQPGLFFAPGRWPGKGPIYVPEGASDVAVLLDLDLAAVGRASNVGTTYLVEFLSRVGKRPVVVLAERDWRLVEGPHDPLCLGCPRCWPGGAGAQTCARALSKALKRPVQVSTVGDYKDVRDWRRQHPLASAAAFQAALTPNL